MPTFIPHRLRVAKLFDASDLEYFLHSVIDAMPHGDGALVSVDDIATTVGKVIEAMLTRAANGALYDERCLSNTAA